MEGTIQLPEEITSRDAGPLSQNQPGGASETRRRLVGPRNLWGDKEIGSHLGEKWEMVGG